MAKKVNDPDDYLTERGEDVESMFNIFSRLHHPFCLPSDSRWLPPVDVFETDEEVVLILDVAHINPKDLELGIKKGFIVIRGIRHEITKFKKRHYHKMEIDYGPFERKINIPITVDEHNIRTQYQDGFLEIRLKKIDDRRQRERIITIEWDE